MLGGGGGRQVPFDVAGAGDKGYIIKIEDLRLMVRRYLA